MRGDGLNDARGVAKVGEGRPWRRFWLWDVGAVMGRTAPNALRLNGRKSPAATLGAEVEPRVAEDMARPAMRGAEIDPAPLIISVPRKGRLRAMVFY